jgi:ferrochelatase
MVVELIDEHRHDGAPRRLSEVPGAGCTVNGAPCAADCCLPPKRPGRPAS